MTSAQLCFHLLGKYWLHVRESFNNKLGSLDHSIKLWDVKSGNEMKSFKGHTDPVR